MNRASIIISAMGILWAGAARAGGDVNTLNFAAGQDGSRFVGMGGAGYALPEGYEGMFVNPAALAFTPFPQIHLEGGTWAGSRGGALALAGWGIGFKTSFWHLSREYGKSYPPEAAFGDNDASVDVAYGRKWGGNLAVGGGVKVFSFQYGKIYKATAAALTFGAKYRLAPAWIVAAGLEDAGGRIKWEGSAKKTPERVSVPGFAAAGVGYEPAGKVETRRRRVRPTPPQRNPRLPGRAGLRPRRRRIPTFQMARAPNRLSFRDGRHRLLRRRWP